MFFFVKLINQLNQKYIQNIILVLEKYITPIELFGRKYIFYYNLQA